MERGIGRAARRAGLGELSGGLGDCGLFLPIAIAMITLNGLNATAVFAGVGAIYVATALYFRVPVPVQPLKAFAAAAIALGLGPAELAAGALLMALIIGSLGLSGLAGALTARFPVVLVRGIQAAVALLLLKAAIGLAERGNWDGLPAIDPAVSVTIAAAAFVVLVLSRRGAMPGSLIVLGAGAIVGLVVGGLPDGVALGPEPVGVAIPDSEAFAIALTGLVIAQIPLTFGNAIVATCDAEREYFGQRAERVRPDRIANSIAAGNVLGGLTGGMPICHGAGGVTAHYAMGARTRWATVFAGAIFIAGGLLFGASLPAVLTVLAPGALAGMLAFVAFEHALLAARLERLDDRLIAVTVGVVTLAAGNLAVGFGVGLALVLGRALVGRRRLPGAGAADPA
jgi:SulP family sulfate permease